MSGFLLDTNVISELTRPQPDRSVLAWLAAVDEPAVYLSVATIAELRYGIERLPNSQRRNMLSAWLFGELPQRFDGRILAIDDATAHAWGQVVARAEKLGRPIGVMDAFLAAACLAHDLTLVTRNEADFRAVTKAVVNPWRA